MRIKELVEKYMCFNSPLITCKGVTRNKLIESWGGRKFENFLLCKQDTDHKKLLETYCKIIGNLLENHWNNIVKNNVNTL
mgnify:CR=1 FL=1